MEKQGSIIEKEVMDLIVASIRYKGAYNEMGHYIQELFKVVKGAAAGPVLALYHDGEYMEEGADIEVCVAVKHPVAGKDVTTRTLEGCRVISITHVGSYEKLHETYAEITEYIKNNGIKTCPPFREIYLKGPGMFLKGNPEKYETEIQMPLEVLRE